MGDVTEEELTEIVNGFLLNAPPGEFMEVVTDVRRLLKNDTLLNSVAPTTFREYNTEQMIKVAAPSGGHKVLISKYGEVAQGEYLDPVGGKVLQFDHIRQEVTGSRAISGELEASLEAHRKAFQAETDNYLSQHYENGAATVYTGKSGGNNVITICISSSKFQPHNYWNGRWRSVWTATFGSGGSCELKGNMRISVHFYEDGNVQLNTSTNKTKSVKGSDAGELAKVALKAIKNIEADFHDALDTSYRKMGDTTFKALRRQLPITRRKIDWDKLSTYRIADNFK